MTMTDKEFLAAVKVETAKIDQAKKSLTDTLMLLSRATDFSLTIFEGFERVKKDNKTIEDCVNNLIVLFRTRGKAKLREDEEKLNAALGEIKPKRKNNYIDWPPFEELKKLVDEVGYKEVAARFKCQPSHVGRHLKAEEKKLAMELTSLGREPDGIVG